MLAPMEISNNKAILFVGLTFVVTLGCDRGDSGSEEATSEPESSEAEQSAERTAAPTPSQPEPPVAQEQEAGAEAEETYTPGAIGVRVVNTLPDPVDLYVRTTGRVRAFPVQEGFAPGAVSEYFFPPEGGNLVATTAGAGNPTCVSHCEHFIMTVRAGPTDGNAHTAVLYDDEGNPRGVDFWENPPAEQVGRFSNAMVPPDPAQGLFVVSTSGLRDARFGLRLGLVGTEGCQTPTNSTNILVGGTQTPAFAHAPGSVEVVLFDNRDENCSGEVVGGPFSVTAAAGERNHLILTGAPGSMQAIVAPMPSVEGP